MEDLTIGQRIAVKRKELGMSQIALSEAMGVSRQSVSKWEADGAIPEIDKLIALSKLFGVSVGWLLGVENNEEPEEPSEADFSDREWEIIDRLTQSQPTLPKWLMPLAAGAAAVSLFAVILAGSAFANARAHREDLAAVSQAVANLTIGADSLAVDTTVLDSYQFLLSPKWNLDHCVYEFIGYPAAYSEDSTAELLIFADGEEVSRVRCGWNGVYYDATFTLEVRNGYSAIFAVTSESGIVRSTVLYDNALNQARDAAAFGTVAVQFEDHEYQDGTLTLRDLNFTIDLPDLLRTTTDLWAQCDLVVLADGQELGRTDILNRSKYSKSVNFGGIYVDFYTQTQSIEIGDLTGFSRVELMLDCGFTTGLDMQKVLHSWTVENGSI